MADFFCGRFGLISLQLKTLPFRWRQVHRIAGSTIAAPGHRRCAGCRKAFSSQRIFD